MNSTALSRPKEKRTLRSLFPIIEWLPKYDRSWIRADAIAAVTVWALLVPEAMAYAGIAGMPPEAGLYAVPLALLAYAIFGTSQHLHVGPSSTVAALSFSVVAGFGAAVASEEWIALTMALAMVVGVLLAIGSALRLGILADFFSRPVLDGFIVGVAITIAVGQLDKILGYSVEEGDFLFEIGGLLRGIGDWHLPTIIVGVTSFALLLLIDKYLPKLPGALIVVVLAILASWLLGWQEQGIHIVGEIPAGLPPLGFPQGIGVGDILALLPGAAAVALVGFAESIAAARSYSLKYNYKINADQELLALGAANFGAGFSGGFTVDGSVSRTAAADDAGAKSQMVSIITAVMVLLTAAFFTGFFFYLPEATLGAIVIHAVLHLIDFKKITQYRGVVNLDFWTAVVALVGVLALGILEGLVLAIGLALMGLLIGSKNYTTAVLGKVPGEDVYRGLEHHPDAELVPGLLIVRYDGSLFFANAPDFADEIRAGVAMYDPQVVLVDGETITDIDATTIATLKELRDELGLAGVDLRFASVQTNVVETMGRAEAMYGIETDGFYPSIQAGVDDFLARQAQSDGDGVEFDSEDETE